ncbi:hypothetical protein LCGC14_0928130, partial [marine sediment metagenome]
CYDTGKILVFRGDWDDYDEIDCDACKDYSSILRNS